MENYTRSVCGCQRTNNCYNIVLAVIGALLAFAVGIIVGVLAFGILISFFTATVAITIILTVLFGIFLILRLCNTTSRC